MINSLTQYVFTRQFIFALFFLFLFSFIPHVARAADPAASPAFNPVCWTKAECATARIPFMPDKSQEELENGWVKGALPCVGTKNDEELGKCLAVGKTTTQISIGGKKTFEHIGDFLITVYKYAIPVASILAVVIIIIAGAQWTVSGGNSEMIGSAKKRIAGALVGLLIALLSYVVLNTINPYLVELKMPQVWMSRKVNAVLQFCSESPQDAKFMLAAKAEDQKVEVKLPETANYDLSLADQSDNNRKNFYCGKRFFSDKGGTNACFGDYCPTGYVCAQWGTDPENPDKLFCDKGMIGGPIYGGVLIGPNTVVADNDVKLIAMCKDEGDIQQIDVVDAVAGKPQTYHIPKTSGIDTICSGKGGVAGFYLGVEVNDETGGPAGWLVGNLAQAAKLPLSSGCDDWFAVGRIPGTHMCSVNLASMANSITNEFTGAAANCGGNPNLAACSCSFASEQVVNQVANNEEFKKYLISLDELQNGFSCAIVIDRLNFPSLNNTEWMEACKFGGVGCTFACSEITDNTRCWTRQHILDQNVKNDPKNGNT